MLDNKGYVLLGGVNLLYTLSASKWVSILPIGVDRGTETRNICSYWSLTKETNVSDSNHYFGWPIFIFGLR